VYYSKKEIHQGPVKRRVIMQQLCIYDRAKERELRRLEQRQLRWKRKTNSRKEKSEKRREIKLAGEGEKTERSFLTTSPGKFTKGRKGITGIPQTKKKKGDL